MKKLHYLLFMLAPALMLTNCKSGDDDLPLIPGPGAALGIETVLIPAGLFLMGSPDGTTPAGVAAESGRQANETPHWVRLTNSFHIGKYEVTKAQYVAFLNAKHNAGQLNYDTEHAGDNAQNRDKIAAYLQGTSAQPMFFAEEDGGIVRNNDGTWSTINGYENQPVNNVTWYGANAFAEWAGGSLPTEAQWEYACRGGKSESLPFGIGDGTKLYADMANFYGITPYDLAYGGSVANYNGSNGHPATYKGTPVQVGSYSYPNSYGLYDMHGNVKEWCLDTWDGTANYPTNTTQSNPQIDPIVNEPNHWGVRVARDGDCWEEAVRMRSASRSMFNPQSSGYNIGFRIVFVR